MLAQRWTWALLRSIEAIISERFDLPLLELVDHPVAVDADEPLTRHARHKGWPVITLRDRDEAPEIA